MKLFYLLLLVPLLFIVYQDYKHRAISWILFPLVFGLLLIRTFHYVEFQTFLKYSLVNLGFVTLQCIGIVAYLYMKRVRDIRIIGKYIGLGDISFLIVLCICFSPANFILFLLVALLSSLLIHSIENLSKNATQKTIPLAGILSASLAVVLIIESVVSDIDFFKDIIVLTPIYQ